MAAGLCPGIVVAVNVGRGVGERVGGGVLVTVLTGVRATAICVPEMSAARTVSAITVGRYSGG